MNKRILFILLPLIAILFSIHSREYGSSCTSDAGSKTIVAAKLSKGLSQVSLAGQKDIPSFSKNKVRVKAWEEQLAFVAPALWIQAISFFTITETPQGQYNFHFLSSAISSDHLRGPPRA
jgi:hypothetical protein